MTAPTDASGLGRPGEERSDESGDPVEVERVRPWRGGGRGLFALARRERGPLGLGVAALFATNAIALSIPWLLKGAIESLEAGAPAAARRYALGMAAAAVVQAAVRVGSRLLILDAARRIEFDLRNALFDHLVTLSPRTFGRLTVGDVMSRCVSDLGQVRLLCGPGVMMAANAATAYGLGIAFMLALSPALTLVALAPYPPLVFLLVRATRVVYQRNREAQERLGELTARIQENLAGQLTVQAFGLFERERRAFAFRNRAHCDAAIRLAHARSAMAPLWGAVASASAVAVLYAGGRAVAAGSITLGALAAFVGYLAALAWPTAMLGWSFALVERGRSAMRRLTELFDARPEVRDPKPDGWRDLAGDLEVRGLGFSFGDGAEPALDDVSLAVRPGETVAVVGPTGAGKSTLAHLLVRLYDPMGGQVRLDGEDLSALPLRALRRQAVIVPQEPFLFSATVAENIAFGRPDASRAEIDSAAEVAQLGRDLAAMPDGLDTVVGERGVALSGGQRARVAVARALLMRPKVLVLDDPFAALDSETAEALLEALSREARDTTVVVITHRLAAVRRAARIAVLDRGRLVEIGTHDALLAGAGRYAALWRVEREREALRAG